MSVYENINWKQLELKDNMWNIYLFMLLQDHSLQMKEYLLNVDVHELKYYLHRLEELGLVKKNIDNSYELVESKKVYVLFYYIYNKIRLSNFIRAFYLSFSLTSMISFIYYVNFLPNNYDTTIFFTFIFIIFTTIFCIIEVVFGTLQVNFIKKILKIHYNIHNNNLS